MSFYGRKNTIEDGLMTWKTPGNPTLLLAADAKSMMVINIFF
jgi:hypothetical protein